ASDAINIAGQGSVTLTPQSDGLYQGIVLFQDRTSSVPLGLSGNGAMTVTGTIYAARAAVTVTGNGGVDGQGIPLDTVGSDYIVADLVVSGNGSLRISAAAAATRFSVIDAPTRVISRYDTAGNFLGSSRLSDAQPTGVASNAAGDTLWLTDADKNVYVY